MIFCGFVGGLGGVVVGALGVIPPAAGATLGVAAGVVFACSVRTRAIDAGAGPTWGLACALLLWLAWPAGLGLPPILLGEATPAPSGYF